jgi:hypothetical protein
LEQLKASNEGDGFGKDVTGASSPHVFAIFGGYHALQ